MDLTVGQAQSGNISSVGTLNNMQPINQPTTPPSGASANNEQLDPKVVRMAKAIRQVESNNNFNAVGDQGTSKGAYQFHNDHFEKWATQYGLDPKDFSSENQNKVAYYKIKELKDQGRTPDEIAAIWNGSHLENGKYVANNPAYVQKVHAAYNQIPDYNPAPFSSGAVDLTPDPNAPQVSNLKDTGTDLAKKGGKGLLNAIGNFGTGVVKGTGQILNAPAKAIANPINNAIFGKKQTDFGNAVTDKTFQPKGTSQKVGAFVGRDVLPATAAVTTAGAGLTAAGVDVPAVLGKIGQLIGKTYRGAKTVGKVAAGTALAAEAIKNPKQVFGLIGKLIDGLSHFGE